MVQDPTRMNHQTRVIHELSSLLLTILRHPDDNMTSSSSSSSRQKIISNGGLVWLMMGVSLALMVCGSLSFFIGFLLMPWVFFLVVLFYIVGVVSSFVAVFRAVFCHAFPSKKGDPGDCFHSTTELCVHAILPYMHQYMDCIVRALHLRVGLETFVNNNSYTPWNYTQICSASLSNMCYLIWLYKGASRANL